MTILYGRGNKVGKYKNKEGKNVVDEILNEEDVSRATWNVWILFQKPDIVVGFKKTA